MKGGIKMAGTDFIVIGLVILVVAGFAFANVIMPILSKKQDKK